MTRLALRLFAPLAGALVAAAGVAGAASARDTVRVVGSSTVYPFVKAAAEEFGIKSGASAPVVEQTGTGGGFVLFCKGVGEDHPDISNASRRIKWSEWLLCQENGVTDIIEIKLGFDGIVVGNAIDGPELVLTTRQVFRALAAELPKADDDCTLLPNPHQTWADVDPGLPPMDIDVLGPPPTSGTRDAFVEIAMEAGALSHQCLAELEDRDPAVFKSIAHKIREDDQHWRDGDENDNITVSTIERTSTTVGVLGWSYLDQNRDKIKGALVDGVDPTFDNIAAGDYPIARSLYIYVKRQHLETVPSLADFALELASEAALDPTTGYLPPEGLIPLDLETRQAARDRILDGAVMSEADFPEANVEAPDAPAAAEASGESEATQ